jgi:hypothetical protein
LDAASLKLFDHVYAVYLPPPRERRPEYAGHVGVRGLFQVVGVISKDDRVGKIGDLALMPRQLRGSPHFGFHRCPISHLVELQWAPPEDCCWKY